MNLEEMADVQENLPDKRVPYRNVWDSFFLFDFCVTIYYIEFSTRSYMKNVIHTDETIAKAREAVRNGRANYYAMHSCCPSCGNDKLAQTYVGYVFNIRDPKSYKDENQSICGCGWAGIVHDLISGG